MKKLLLLGYCLLTSIAITRADGFITKARNFYGKPVTITLDRFISLTEGMLRGKGETIKKDKVERKIIVPSRETISVEALINDKTYNLVHVDVPGATNESFTTNDIKGKQIIIIHSDGTIKLEEDNTNTPNKAAADFADFLKNRK
jgi:hypothetical protein